MLNCNHCVHADSALRRQGSSSFVSVHDNKQYLTFLYYLPAYLQYRLPVCFVLQPSSASFSSSLHPSCWLKSQPHDPKWKSASSDSQVLLTKKKNQTCWMYSIRCILWVWNHYSMIFFIFHYKQTNKYSVCALIFFYIKTKMAYSLHRSSSWVLIFLKNNNILVTAP